MTDRPSMLLVGASGMLAGKVATRFGQNWAITPVDLPEFDLTDKAGVQKFVSTLKPQLIINCAAYTNVDGCETQEELAMQVNGAGVGYLAEAARECDATLVHISTDYVFPGRGSEPLREDAPVAPQSAYGRSKLAGEQAILSSGIKKFFIVRTSWLYGPGGGNFVETILRLAREREELNIVSDQIGSPTYTGDLAEALYALTRHLMSHGEGNLQPEAGIYHFSNEGACSWYDFARGIVSQAREQGAELRVREINPITTAEFPLPAKRPAYSVLSTKKYRRATGATPPPWQESLATYLDERQNL